MEEIVQIFLLNISLEAKQSRVGDILTEQSVKLLTYEELNVLVKSSLNRFVLEVPDNEDVNVLISQVISLLHHHRRNDILKIISNLTEELLADESLDLLETILTLRKYIAIELVRNVISPLISQKIPELTRRIQQNSSLPILFNIAAIINKHEECLPLPQSQQQFCIDIINHVAQLTLPTSQKVEFMQAISEISSAVKKVWLNSPKSSTALPCLVHIYTLMTGIKMLTFYLKESHFAFVFDRFSKASWSNISSFLRSCT